MGKTATADGKWPLSPKGDRGVFMRVDPAVRLREKMGVGDPDECWPWMAHVDKYGYGIFWTGERQANAHRIVYEQYVGPIPEGFQVDHTCHNGSGCEGGVSCRHRSCVNPAHLEAVTQATNLLRGTSWTAVNARKTHCHRGHELSGHNLMTRSNGDRRCRTCAYATNIESMARRKAMRRRRTLRHGHPSRGSWSSGVGR